MSSNAPHDPPPAFGTPEMLEDPFPFYARKRRECPVFRLPDTAVHIVTRRDDIERVALDLAAFSNKGRSPQISYPGQRYQTMPDLTGMDGEEHKLLRTAHLAFFSAKRLREMRPALEAEAHRLIDTFVDQPKVEFIAAFARPFPAWVMGSALLGLPRDMHDRLDRWAVNYFNLFDRNLHRGDAPDPEMIKSYVDFTNYCGDLAASHRDKPQDTLLSEFVNFRKPDGSQYTIDEMANYIRLLVVGAQTSANLMAQAMIDTVRLLASRPDFDLTEKKAWQKILDESLRVDGPATYGPRICTRDAEVGGVELPAGTRLMLAWQSGNRDAEVFENPDHFQPDRAKLAKHLGFGLGAHRCIGAPLAQLEGEVGLDAMFKRFRNIRLSADNDYRHDTSLISMRNLMELHLELEKR